MRINVRRNVIYKEVTVEDGNTTIETGLMDERECRALADALREAADELMHGFEEVASA